MCLCIFHVYFFCQLRAAWVKHNSIHYQPAAVVVLNVEDNMPVFGRIERIFIVNSNGVFFYVKILSTIQTVITTMFIF